MIWGEQIEQIEPGMMVFSHKNAELKSQNLHYQ